MKMIFRHFRVAAFVALGLLAGAVGGALGQAGWYQIISPTGAELVQALVNASAYQNYVTINQIRNTTGYLLTSVATGSLTATTNANRYIFTAALSGGVTLTTPATTALADGEMIEVVNGTGSAFTQTITLTAASGQTVNSGAVATLAAGSSAEWQYAASTTTWYRLR